MVFCDRLLLTLVHLRHWLPHEVLAELYDVDRSTARLFDGDPAGPLVDCGPWFRCARPARNTSADAEGPLRIR
ncbi:transposase family protein [Streptomyces sp. AC512_CC834]|uniref:helix-turn-helix domain-containing protein n=1 Tax=Streptomyces sp. AC512_CC834 TaxID=2823691 RepID=UPI0035AE1293